MTRVLVLGGYGGFGARISRRLAAAGHEVLVAGRSRARAEAFCRRGERLIPTVVDRKDIAAALSHHAPLVLVDASGPFQEMNYAVPRACLAAGVHYCDIADSRRFVCDISQLDADAKRAGVVIVSGASSIPALSGAVVRSLSRGMRRVTSVEMAISASNRASAGPAVSAAILGQVGQRFELRRGGRRASAYGWQEPKRITFSLPGREPVRGRLVALVDVPDVELLPDRLPGQPAVTFRAGTELPFQNIGLWLASWLVRWRWVGSLAPFTRWLAPVQRLTGRLGTDRSAMMVRVFGYDGERRVERRWTLIAAEGDGPEIPSLTVPLLVERIVGGQELPGARDAGQALELADYEAAFARLAIDHHVEERVQAEPLYHRVMGGRFAALPPAIRRMHEVLRDGGATGEAEVIGAAHPAGSAIARMMRFPPPGRYDLHVHFSECRGSERWTRSFGRFRFSSCLSAKDGHLIERFGPLRFHFALPSDEGGLAMEMKRWSAFGLPLPLAFAPRSRAREWESEGRFCFDVPVALPLLGRIIHYRGWLVSPQREAKAPPTQAAGS